MMVLQAALYARVSTDQQDTDAQVSACRQAIAARGWTLAAEFTDVMSGTKASWPGLDALRAT